MNVFVATPHGKLPILELPDGTVLSDSIAIARYVARLTGFYPEDSDPIGQAKVDGLVGFVKDFLEVVVKVPFETDEAAKSELIKKINGEVLPELVTRCEKTLKDNGEMYLVGQKVKAE